MWMGLSNDLISQFVKMTNDKKETNDRSSAYGTVVEYNGTSYVKFDGSDLLTPVDSSIVLHDKDRVIVDINKHTAVATGNLSNPSVSGVEISQTEGKLRVEFEEGLKNLELYFKDEMAKLDIGFADGIHAGITSVDKDGIKVQHTAYNGYTHMCYDGFYINYGGSDVLKCTSSGLVYTGTITASVIQSTDGAFKIDEAGNITGASLTSSKGDNFSIDENGTITASALAIEGNISTDTIVCRSISNKAYPRTLSSGVTLYVNVNSGSDDVNSIVNGTVFKTLQGLINALPKFLNGKTVVVYIQTNLTENVRITYFTSGKMIIYFNRHTLYGAIEAYNVSTDIAFYGGQDTEDTSRGTIHPSVGFNAASRSSSVHVNKSRLIGIYNMNIYSPDNQVSGLTGDKLCVGCQGGGYLYCKNINIVNADVGFRCNSGSQLHMDSSSGIAKKYGFQVATGGKISFANNNQAGGTTGATNRASGGQLWYDSATFASGDSSSSSSTAPSTGTTTTTKTYTSSSAQALQYAGTSSAFWRSDCKPKAGNWGYGAHTGWWFFGDDFEDMASKNVSKIQITFTREKAGNYAATSHNFYVHNYETQPSTTSPSYNTSKIASASVAVNNSYTMTITDSTIINRIKAAKGICCVPPSQSSTYYSVMSATMKVKFTYKG